MDFLPHDATSPEAVDRLLDLCFGPARRRRTASILREGAKCIDSASFVVLDGEATVTLLVEGEDAGRIELRAGSLCRLDAGSTTRWDVSRTLRKAYVIEKEATRA